MATAAEIVVPHFSLLKGGHRFASAKGQPTAVDHELEMTPKGLFKIFTPFIEIMGKKNPRRAAAALQKYVEGH